MCEWPEWPWHVDPTISPVDCFVLDPSWSVSLFGRARVSCALYALCRILQYRRQRRQLGVCISAQLWTAAAYCGLYGSHRLMSASRLATLAVVVSTPSIVYQLYQTRGTYTKLIHEYCFIRPRQHSCWLHAKELTTAARGSSMWTSSRVMPGRRESASGGTGACVSGGCGASSVSQFVACMLARSVYASGIRRIAWLLVAAVREGKVLCRADSGHLGLCAVAKFNCGERLVTGCSAICC